MPSAVVLLLWRAAAILANAVASGSATTVTEWPLQRREQPQSAVQFSIGRLQANHGLWGGGEGDVAASAKIAASAPALQVCGNCHDVEDRGVVAGHRHNEELQSSSTAQETAAKQKSEACRSARHNHEFFLVM